jgi:nucleotide-binding universal stress UspA family protein
MYKHILFPSDGSKASEHVLQYVCELAQKFNAEVTVLHAYEFLEVIPVYETTYAYLDELENYLESQSSQIANEIRQKLEQHNLNVHTAVIKGDPGYSIVNTAEEKKCDLIVMGSRGLGPVKRFLLGSVSHYVVNHAKCPVMIIPGVIDEN